jgi:hypothetical protein
MWRTIGFDQANRQWFRLRTTQWFRCGETMPQVCAKELLLSTLAGTAVALAATLP